MTRATLALLVVGSLPLACTFRFTAGASTGTPGTAGSEPAPAGTPAHHTRTVRTAAPAGGEPVAGGSPSPGPAPVSPAPASAAPAGSQPRSASGSSADVTPAYPAPATAAPAAGVPAATAPASGDTLPSRAATPVGSSVTPATDGTVAPGQVRRAGAAEQPEPAPETPPATGRRAPAAAQEQPAPAEGSGNAGRRRAPAEAQGRKFDPDKMEKKEQTAEDKRRSGQLRDGEQGEAPKSAPARRKPKAVEEPR